MGGRLCDHLQRVAGPRGHPCPGGKSADRTVGALQTDSTVMVLGDPSRPEQGRQPTRVEAAEALKLITKVLQVYGGGVPRDLTSEPVEVVPLRGRWGGGPGGPSAHPFAPLSITCSLPLPLSLPLSALCTILYVSHACLLLSLKLKGL